MIRPDVQFASDTKRATKKATDTPPTPEPDVVDEGAAVEVVVDDKPATTRRKGK